MVIDVHAHYMPKTYLTEHRSIFELRNADIGVDLYANDMFLQRLNAGICDLTSQVADMERNGIDQRFLSILPSCFYYEKEQAIDWCKSFNDGIIQDIPTHYKNKFRILANLPMCSIDEACFELERVMRSPLVVGAQIATNIVGKELDGFELEPFWALAEKLGAFILLHPAYVLSGQRFQQYHLRPIVSNPLDTTIAAIRLMVGGVLERYPRLSICLSHAGGYLPFVLPRFDHGKHVFPEFSHFGTKSSEIAKKLYYDTIVFDPNCLEFAVARMGADRFMLGSDYPFDMGDPEPVRIVDDTRLSKAERDGILALNIQRAIGEKCR